MSPGKSLSAISVDDEISALILTLHEAGRRLEELTQGEVDTVAGADGRTFLLQRSQDHLRYSEAAKRAAILDALPANIALLDAQGLIVSVNNSWRAFASAGVTQCPGHEQGVDYLAICDDAQGSGAGEAHRIASGIRSVLAGTSRSFSIEYPCDSPTEQRWFLMTATPLADDPPNGAVVMHLDITARKRAEEAQISVAQLLDNIVEHIPTAVQLKSARDDFRILMWNKAAEAMYGLPREAAIGHNVRDIWPAADAAFMNAADAELVATRGTQDFPDRIAQTMNRGNIDVHMRKVALLDAGGNPTHVLVIADDITARKKTAQDLLESESRFRQMAEHIRDVFFLMDAEKDIFLYVSAAYEEILGRTRESLYANRASWTEAIHPDDWPRITDIFNRGMVHGSFEYECRIVRPDGTMRWLNVRGFAVRDDAGKTVRIAGVAKDITERRQAEADLRASELRFRQMAESIDDIFFLQDIDGSRIHYVSPAFEKIWGRTCEGVYANPRSWSDLIHPDDWRDASAHFTATAGRGFDYEFRIVRDDGELRWIHVRGFPILNDQGIPYRTAGTCSDITQRKLAEQGFRESERRFSDLLRDIELASVMLDREARITFCNDYLLRLTGWRREEVIGRNWFEVFIPAQHREVKDAFAQLLADAPEAWHREYEILGRWGERRLMRWSNSVLRSATGEVIGSASIGEDITDQRRAEVRIKHLNRIHAVIGGISSAMLRIHDREELLQEACRVAGTEGVFPMAWVAAPDPQTGRFEVVASHGKDPQIIEFLRLAMRRSIPETDQPSYRAAQAKRPIVINDLSIEPTLAPLSAELQRRGYHSGAALPLFVEGSVVAVLVLLSSEYNFFDAEEVALLEWLAADLSFALEHIQNARRLDHLAYYDALTGLPNASLFRDRLEQLVHAARQEQCKVCVVVVDLEHFTRINDTLGRAVGDELLRKVGERFRHFLTEPYALGRIGADTFAVASSRDPELIATSLRDRMLGALDQPFNVDGREVRVAAQAGIALYPADGDDGGGVFKNAEAALKLAKSGGQRYAYYSSALNAQVAQRLALVEELRHAVDALQFVLHFQPRVDMISGALIGAEALIRWQHPQRGLLAPAEFISLAEESGLIVAIGSWVIHAVCAQQARWSAAGTSIVPMAVNLSSVQFEQGDLLQTVREALAENALDAKQLDLELTESAVMNDPAAAARTLRSLRDLGVGLALDDFGTGYSSLAHLKRFPFDSVKIDRSFVTDITTNAEDAAIATAIIAMAHSLKLKVVAEGVETQGQFNYLRANGCDEMQGFLFGPAVASDEFEYQLRTSKRLLLPAQAPADLHTLLVVDDEHGIRAALTRTLRRDGYRILTAASGSEGLELLAVNAVQVIISDQRMPDMSGTEFLNTVKQLYPETMRIILSGYTDLKVVTDAVNRGSVFKFLTKPWDDDLLREQVRDAFRRYRPERPTVAL